MAHECPKCYLTCYCNGDIDDINFGESNNYCSHCEDEDNDEDYTEYDHELNDDTQD